MEGHTKAFSRRTSSSIHAIFHHLRFLGPLRCVLRSLMIDGLGVESKSEVEAHFGGCHALAKSAG